MAMFDNPKQTVPETHLGEAAAHQPLSGIVRVDESGAVNGLGHGAFIRHEETEKAKPAKTR